MAVPIPQASGLVIRSDRRFVKGRFAGFRLTVRLKGVLMEQVDVRADLDLVNSERDRLEQKWLAKLG